VDYLGMQKPAWMAGSSLLGELDPKRLILAGSASNIIEDSTGNAFLSPEAFRPPFYQFGSMTVIQYQKLYAYNLADMTVSPREIKGYQNPCPDGLLDSQEVIHKEVGSLLLRFGFNLPDNW